MAQLTHYTTGGLYQTKTGHTYAHLIFTSHTRHSPPAHLCYNDGSHCLMAHTKACTCMNSLGTEEPRLQNCVCVWKCVYTQKAKPVVRTLENFLLNEPSTCRRFPAQALSHKPQQPRVWDTSLSMKTNPLRFHDTRSQPISV